jgi:hypothetical protein
VRPAIAALPWPAALHNAGLSDAGLRRPDFSDIPLKSAHLAEEKILSAWYNDFLSGWQDEENAGGVQKARLFHVCEINDAVAGGAKESGAIQPALAILKLSSDQDGTRRQMNARLLAAGFEKPDIPRLDEPTFPVAT